MGEKRLTSYKAMIPKWIIGRNFATSRERYRLGRERDIYTEVCDGGDVIDMRLGFYWLIRQWCRDAC